MLVVGGEFSFAASTSATRLAAYDPTTGTWSAFGTGMNGTVRALAVRPNGNLVAGGDFVTAGGVTVNRVAEWHPAPAQCRPSGWHW